MKLNTKSVSKTATSVAVGAVVPLAITVFGVIIADKLMSAGINTLLPVGKKVKKTPDETSESEA